MLLDNGLGYGKSQAKAGLLGRKIRLKYLTQCFLADANAGIGHRNLDGVADHRDPYAEMSPTGHRLKRIDDEVREAGSQSFAIAEDFDRGRTPLKCYFNTLFVSLWTYSLRLGL